MWEQTRAFEPQIRPCAERFEPDEALLPFLEEPVIMPRPNRAQIRRSLHRSAAARPRAA